jgi:O-antigen/teichoic acid export membrane protein
MISTLYSGLVPTIYVPYAWILLGAIFFGNIFNVITGSFYGLQQESIGEALNLGRRVIYTSFALFLAYAGYDLFGVFIGYTLSFILMTVIGLIVLVRRTSHTILSDFHLDQYGREIASYGGYQLVGGFSLMLLYKSDILLVEFFRGSTATALYQSAIIPAEMVWFVPLAIQLAFLQHTSELWDDEKINEINNNIQTGIKYAILSLTLFGAGLFLLSDPFLRVYFSSEYASASPILQMLIIGTFFFGITRVVVPVLQATGWVRKTELVTTACLILNIFLNILLIPKFGIYGAGIATSTSYFAIFIGNIILWHKSAFDLVPLRWIGKLAAVQVAFIFVFSSIVRLSSLSPILSLITLPPIGLFLFLLINIYAGYIPTQSALSYIKNNISY